MTENPTARLLDCGFCYEEQGEEVHPHPECPIGRVASPAAVSVAGQTLLGAAEVETRPDLNVAPLTDDQLAADEEVELTGQTALRDLIAAALYGNDHPGHLVPLNKTGMEAAYQKSADAVLAVLPPPADRAAEFELRGTAEIRAAVYAEVAARLKADAEEGAKDGFTRIYRRAAADRVRVWANEVAAEAPAPETHQPVKPTSHTWTFEVCYDGDKWHGCGPTYDDSVFGNAHETAQEDFQHRAENDKQRRRFRMIRATTTYVVEAEHQAAAVSAGVQPDTEARPRQSCACGQDGCEYCDADGTDEEADRG